jgi:prophage regulatory protein
MAEILRRRATEARVGLQKSAIYQRIKEGTFPKPVVLGPRSVGWISSELDAWVAQRIAERDAKDGEGR